MSQVNIKLQTKVKNIALGCITLHVIGLAAEIIQLLLTSNRHVIKNPMLQPRTIISITMESLLGLLTCILLYVGAKKKNKFLLIPFMLVMVLLQVLLVITLFIFGMLCLNGDPIIFGGMAFIIALLLITGWMLKTTRAFYNDIRDTEGYGPRSRQVPDTSHPDNHFVNTVVLPYTEEHAVLSDIEANCRQVVESRRMHQVEQTDRQVRILNRINLPAEAPSGPSEPPPAYNETTTILDDGVYSDTSGYLPPSYDEAMAMKKQDPNVDHD